MIKSLERLIDQYQADITDFQDANSAPQESQLWFQHLTTQKISNDLILIRLRLSSYKNHRQYDSVNTKLNQLQYTVDSTRHRVHKDRRLLQAQKAVHSNTAENINYDSNGEIVEDVKLQDTTTTGANPTYASEDITSLRKRLLSTSSIVPQQQINTYHENLQQDLINDLSSLAGDLKLGAYNLSMKILEDNYLLSKTSDNLMKNNNLMDLVGGNLNNYVMNKSGGKILFWFLLKTLGFILTLFLVMIIIIKIFPKL